MSSDCVRHNIRTRRQTQCFSQFAKLCNVTGIDYWSYGRYRLRLKHFYRLKYSSRSFLSMESLTSPANYYYKWNITINYLGQHYTCIMVAGAQIPARLMGRPILIHPLLPTSLQLNSISTPNIIHHGRLTT